MTLSKEVKVGLLALVAGVILYIGFNFLKGVDFFSPTRKYYVVYDDIDGLTQSNPVTLNGLTVGRVDNITLMPDRGHKILVELDIDDNIILGDSTLALLSNTDLLGGKSIDLKLGRNTRIFEKGDTLKGFKEQNLTDKLTQKALPLIDNLDSTVVMLQRLFGDDVGSSIKKTLHNFEQISGDLRVMLAQNKGNISAATADLAALASSLKETEKDFKPLLAKLNAMADSLNDAELKQTMLAANKAMKNLEDVTTKINNGQGSLGMLVNDKGLYNNLNNSTGNLDKLFIDVRKNPKRYIHFSVFGKKDKGSKEDPAPIQTSEKK